MSTEIKTKHNHNIEHEVTNCSFLTAKYLKCDCFTECLFTWIMYMIETISDINQFKEAQQDTCFGASSPFEIFLKKMLILAFEANIVAFLNCTFFIFLSRCALEGERESSGSDHLC